MKSKQFKNLCLTLIVGCLFILPTGVSAAPTAAGEDSPEAAVTMLVTPFYDQSANNAACNAVSGRVEACPVSARLLKRLQNPDTGPGSGNLIGRTQNPPGNVTVAPATMRGEDALVTTTWQSGASAYNIVFLVIHQADGWVVDDSFCADPSEGTSTSIYNSPVVDCQILNIGGGPVNSPGMPTTGANQPASYAWLALLGTMLVALGLGSRLSMHDNS